MLTICAENTETQDLIQEIILTKEEVMHLYDWITRATDIAINNGWDNDYQPNETVNKFLNFLRKIK